LTTAPGLTKFLRMQVANTIRHVGHAGARPEGETHFTVEIVASSFAGRSRVERQRLVHAALADLLRERVHALALKTLTPEEDRARGAG
jgi:BolA protein